MKKLYTNLKIFHFSDKLDSLTNETDEIKPPIHIRIKPTNVCNHRCSYCAYLEEDLQLGKDMKVRDYIPREKMISIIDDLDEMGVKAVTFSGGGDPFCYPYLSESIKKLANAEIKFAALTNGSRLSGEVTEIFSHKGSWLRVSMDGWDDASYVKYRNVKDGEYTKIMNNMEKFNKLNGPCLLGVSLIIDKYNADHIYHSVQRLKNIGIRSIKISGCVVSNSGIENNQYHKDIFDKVKEQITKAKEDFSDSSFEISDSYHMLEENFEKKYDWCPYLQILPVIAADMNVYSCHDKAYNLDCGILGSLKDQSFKEFWFSNKNKFFEIDPSKHCNHHCCVNSHNKLILDYLNIYEDHLDFV